MSGGGFGRLAREWAKKQPMFPVPRMCILLYRGSRCDGCVDMFLAVMVGVDEREVECVDIGFLIATPRGLQL